MNEKNSPHSPEYTRKLELRFVGIFAENEYKLHTLAKKLTKSDLYAKDIIQEVFLSLWDHRHEIDKINNIEAWLYRATENKVIDFLRKAAVNDRLKEAIWENLKDILENETIAFVEGKECEGIIQKLVANLPPQRQMIYRMNRERGLSYQEIADELNLSRHTVKNQLFTAIGSIRKLLHNHNILLLTILFCMTIGIVSVRYV